MPKTVQIRNIDDNVYRELAIRAAAQGVSVPEFLRNEATRLATRPSLRQWSETVANRPGHSRISREHIIASLDEIRGE